MFRRLVVLVSMVILISSCSQHNDQTGEVLYRYTGDFISLVDQRQEPVNKEYGITFTLTMDQFHPSDPVFKKANTTYPDDHEGFRHVDFTERTKVYIQKGNTKTQVPPTELFNYTKPFGPPRSDISYQKLEVWITPYKKNDWFIEAVEVVILQDS